MSTSHGRQLLTIAEGAPDGLEAAGFRFRPQFVTILLAFSIAFFLVRGPYRAIWRNSAEDFSLVYSMGRAWIAGQNPYSVANLDGEFVRARRSSAELPPANLLPMYFPPALPMVAIFAWMPWHPAIWSWTLTGMTIFALAVLAMVRLARVQTMKAAVLMTAALLCFGPASTGVAMGNPSVIACGMLTLAVYFFVNGRRAAGATLIGLALCLKPQMGICGVAVLAVWRCWSSLLGGLLIPILATAASAARAESPGQFLAWCSTLAHNIAFLFAPAQLNDPSALNPQAFTLLNFQSVVGIWLLTARTENLVAWMAIATLAVLYLYRWQQRSATRDLAFFSAITLASAYSRYYDGQILLLALPLVVESWRTNRARAFAMCALLSALWFPFQTMLHVWFGTTVVTMPALLLLRVQPLAVMALAVVLVQWRAAGAESEYR